MVNFNKDMSIEEILERMDKNTGDRSGGSNTAIMPAGAAFLQFRLHQELFSEQQKAHKDLIELTQKSQKENLTATTRLVLATWALVAATLLMAFLYK